VNILNPINFFRDFRNDFPTNDRRSKIINKIFNIKICTLPLIALHQPFAKALTPVFSGCRLITNFSQLAHCLKKSQMNRLDVVYCLFQTCLTVFAIGLSILNPLYGMIGSSISDIISNGKECILNLKKGQYKESLEAFARIVLSGIFLGIIFYGSIELTVAMFVLQIAMGCYESVDHFRKGEFIEGLLKALTAGIYVDRAIPQVKVLQWKRSYKPNMEAVLRQDENGFVYLDLPDDYIKSLHKHLGDPDAKLPPYFGRGKAGAHISIIGASEKGALENIPLSELGKKFEFRIAHTESLKPLHFKGVEEVSFLTVACPQMEALRSKYGYTPRSNGHDFHITYAIKYEA
jgi:hypothetical protein